MFLPGHACCSLLLIDCQVSLKPLTCFHAWCMWTLNSFAFGILNCAGCPECSEGWGLHPAAQEGLDVSGFVAHSLYAVQPLGVSQQYIEMVPECVCVGAVYIHLDYGVLGSKWLAKGACYAVICSQLQHFIHDYEMAPLPLITLNRTHNAYNS